LFYLLITLFSIRDGILNVIATNARL